MDLLFDEVTDWKHWADVYADKWPDPQGYWKKVGDHRGAAYKFKTTEGYTKTYSETNGKFEERSVGVSLSVGGEY